ARANGVTYLTDEVVGLERDGNRIAAARLKAGDRIACGTLVNAAGAWAGRLAALADIPLSVEPRTRFVYMINCREPVEPLAPLLIDPTGIYF
ncbi:FAD-dependent oxidoreductase, partial [Acinetobacter baumannii]